MNAKTDFKRVWMITGAARGIGARIAEAALAHGDAVVATSRDAASVQKRFPAGDALLALPLDVTDEAQAAAAVQAALARFGRIDVLVNNAGYGLLGAVEEATADEVRRLYDTNVFGLLNVTRAVLPSMRARRSGRVINISSLGGYQSGPGFGVYCSTKFAVEGLSEALHGELAPLGIHVTVVEPGYFRTDFLDGNSLAVSPRIWTTTPPPPARCARPPCRSTTTSRATRCAWRRRCHAGGFQRAAAAPAAGHRHAERTIADKHAFVRQRVEGMEARCPRRRIFRRKRWPPERAVHGKSKKGLARGLFFFLTPGSFYAAFRPRIFWRATCAPPARRRRTPRPSCTRLASRPAPARRCPARRRWPCR
jgi:NAD(P)-dependent dehydrogenase (short-subunit alcohol dehydrogenase family)